MRVPVVLFLLSLTVAAFALVRFGPVLSDLLLLGLLSTIATLLLILRERRRTPREPVVLDGSNIHYWRDERPSLGSVREVAESLRRQGMEPIIWFDANVGYKVGDRYLGPAALAKRLGCGQSQVRVAPKGSPADPLLLQEAMRLNARVVSDDRFRDWFETFPQLRRGELLVRSAPGGGVASLKP